MSNGNFYEDSVERLAAQADIVGRLAQDSGAFAAAVAAFEARDPDAFRWVLGRLELLTDCELICEWIRIKVGVLRCAVVCGPLAETAEPPDLPGFARAIGRLVSNEQALRRVVDAVACGNGEEYRAAIAQLELTRFCHLICYWVYSIIYVRVCEIVCTPTRLALPDPVNDIRAAARVIGGINEATLAAIARAATALNCQTLRTTIERAGLLQNCEIICRLICVWRCGWVCRELCVTVPPIVTGLYGIEEAREFALAARQLAAHPRALGELVGAVQGHDAKTYGELVARFGLTRYCLQVCAWVCSVSCSEFCICVCPPPELLPEFTAIGVYQYKTQIDSALPATGLTVGDTRAFYGNLRLNGILPQTLGGQPIEYRFEYQLLNRAATTLAAAITAGATSITVASSAGFPAAPFNIVVGGANGGYEIMTVTLVAATTWTVLRGRQGTAAQPAAAGALVATATTPAGTWTPVAPAQIARTVIGLWEHFVGGPDPIETKVYTVNGIPGPNELVAPFTPDGWIQVPQMNNVFSAAGAFFPNGNMIELISASLAPFAPVNEVGVSAGNPANHPLPTDLYFGLRMRVRQQGSATSSDGGTCHVVAIDNTLYTNVNHHPEWDGGIPPNPEYAVAMVDIKELQADGCAGITDSLTVLFTASHPNLGPVSITMTGPGGPYGFTLPTPVPETGDRYGTAVNDFTLANLTPCAYIVTLAVTLLLTTGDSDFPTPLIDQIAFCLT